MGLLASFGGWNMTARSCIFIKLDVEFEVFESLPKQPYGSAPNVC